MIGKKKSKACDLTIRRNIVEDKVKGPDATTGLCRRIVEQEEVDADVATSCVSYDRRGFAPLCLTVQ